MLRVFISIALAFSPVAVKLAHASNSKIELRDVFEGWSQLKSRLRHSKVVCEERIVKSGQNVSEEITTYTIVANGDMIRIDTALPEQLSSAVIGGEYFFGVEKAAKAKSYAIRVLDVNERIETAMNGEVSTYRERMLGYLFPAVSIASVDGENYFTANGIAIHSIVREDSGFTTIKYDLRYDDAVVRAVGLEPYTSVGATVELDSVNDWRVISFSIPMPEATLSGKIEYDESGFPKKYIGVYERSDYREETVREYRGWEDYLADPMEFSLVSFGLPEPNVESLRSGPQKNTRSAFTILGMLLLSTGAGLWLNARLKKKSQKEP
jgi:hypothetical protein